MIIALRFVMLVVVATKVGEKSTTREEVVVAATKKG